MRTPSAIFLTALLLFPPLAACADAPPASVDDAIAPYTSRARLETFTSGGNAFDTHSYWLDTGRDVVVFDAQFTPSVATQLIAEIRSKTSTPIRWVVLTHPNPDKFNGAAAFQAIGAKVVASEATATSIPGVHAYKKHYFVNVAKTFTEETYPAEAKIDLTFNGSFDLPLEGGVVVKLRELEHRGVSSTQTVAFVPHLGAVITGDLVHHKAHAWLEGGIVDGKPTPDLGSWLLALDELQSVYPTSTVHGGRGEPATPIEEAVKAEKDYLERLNAIVVTYIASLGPSASTELTSENAQHHYRALRALAERAFPDHALPYMIEYGVYGLAQQIAAAR